MAVLPVDCHGRAGFYELPVGFPAAGSRLPGDLLRGLGSTPWQIALRGTLHRHDLAVPPANLPADVQFGRGQTDQSRSDMARSDRHDIPLLDTAAAFAAGLVCRAVASVVPPAFDGA